MATIYSNRNDNTGAHSTVSALATSTWAGGVVPGSVDIAYVVGRRTTVNESAFSKWAGTRTITVASTANFASSGYFYTVTNGDEILKINYTGTTGTTFTGCSVDETNSFNIWNSGQTIPNGAYIHNPAFIIEVSTNQTFEVTQLIIQEGGWIHVNGGTLKVNEGILLRDGRLTGSSGTILISRPAGTTSSSTIGYLTAENFQLSVIDIDGLENRLYGNLSVQANKGDTSITVDNVANGSFAVGDEIAVYELNDYRRRNIGYTGYRDASANFKDLDEGLDIVGVSGSTLYVGRRNGAKGTIKAVSTEGSQKVLEVQPESIYFNTGDKIVINNVGYTIDNIEDSEVELYNYDFTNPGTSLADFWVNDDRHIYSASWSIESGVGLRNTSGSYRELVHKTLWTREVILEAEMSPRSAWTSGTLGTAAFGLLTSYDPAYRWGHRGYDSFKTDMLTIDDANQDALFYIRSMSNYVNNRPDRVPAFRTTIQNPAKYRVENRKMRSTVYINGEEFTTEFRRDGAFKGLVGLYTNGNTNFRCKSLRILMPTQKIYITTANSISVNQKVYESGIDHTHLVGSRVLKIASINTGTGSHSDLAFAYRGQDMVNSPGEWPLIIQRNGVNATHSDTPYLHNHDMNPDYHYNLGETTSQVGFTIDLLSQKTFTHVSFIPRTNDTGGFYGFNNVAIYGSNDLSSWTTIYGPTNDTKKWYGAGGSYGRMAYYATGTRTFRYVKFETRGDQGGSNRNRYVNIGVHDFSEGYTINLNNASDFNIGDKISVSSDSGYGWHSREYEAYQAIVLSNNTDPEQYMHGGWISECTITNKVGNKIYLDKPVWWGYIEDADSVTVFKTNKNFLITGQIRNSNAFSDWRWPNISLDNGGSVSRVYLFKNLRLQYIGSYRYSGSSSLNRGFLNSKDNYFAATLLDGVSSIMGPDGTTWSGNIGSNSASLLILRNSFITGAYTGMYIYYPSSFSGSSVFNTKFVSHVLGIYAEAPRAFSINYNEFASHEYSVTINGQRTDRMAIPFLQELRFNYAKGTLHSGFRITAESVGPRRGSRIKIENNKARGMDDFPLGGSNTFDAWPFVNSNFMSEHTGSRMSRYRNEGFLPDGDTSSDLSWSNYQKNFGRFGYDIQKGFYHFVEKDPSRPDVTRVYNPNGDAWLWIAGMELDVLENVPFQVYVKFDYRVPLMANLQDDGTDDGRIRVYNIQHATVLSSQYGVVPNTAGNGWQTFEGTFSNFQAQEGRAGVFLSRSAQNGYMDIRNGVAYLLTDYPNKIKVIANTFNFDNIWDQHREFRDTRPLTAPTRATKVTRVKF